MVNPESSFIRLEKKVWHGIVLVLECVMLPWWPRLGCLQPHVVNNPARWYERHADDAVRGSPGGRAGVTGDGSRTVTGTWQCSHPRQWNFQVHEQARGDSRGPMAAS